MTGAQRAKSSRMEMKLERSSRGQAMHSFEDHVTQFGCFLRATGRSLRSFRQKDDIIRIETFTVPHKFPFKNEESVTPAAESTAKQSSAVQSLWKLPEPQSHGDQDYVLFTTNPFQPDQCRGIKTRPVALSLGQL